MGVPDGYGISWRTDNGTDEFRTLIFPNLSKPFDRIEETTELEMIRMYEKDILKNSRY